MRTRTIQFYKAMVALTLVLIIGLGSNTVALAQSSNNPIQVTVDGTRIHFEGTQPIMVASRVLVPVRGVFEALGYDVEWLAPQRVARLERRVTHYTEIHSINIPVDGTTFTSHHWGDAPQVITPDVPQQLINGRTMLPLRAISEAMVGVDVRWDGSNRTVIITTRAGADAGNATPTATPSPMPTATPSSTPASSVTPTPATTPAPTAAPPVSGFVDINDIAPRNFTRNEWRESIESTMSAIQLPNRRLTEAEQIAWRAEYQALGGMNAFELEVVRLVNEIRVEHGLEQLVIDPVFSEAARFYAQTLTDLNLPLSHVGGPYGGPGGAPRAWGYRGSIGGNARRGGDIPQSAVDAWMNSPGHRAAILAYDFSFIGVGSSGITTYMPLGMWDAINGDPSVIW